MDTVTEILEENGHSDRNTDYEIRRQKATWQKLGCEFIRIDLDKEDFGIVWVVRKMLETKILLSKKSKQNRIMVASNCVFCGKEKSRFPKSTKLH